VELAKALGLLDERLTVIIGELLPALPQLLADLCVVHVRLDLGDLSALDLGPHHERVHGTLDVVGRLLALGRVRVGCGRIGVNQLGAEGGVGGHESRGVHHRHWAVADVYR